MTEYPDTFYEVHHPTVAIGVLYKLKRYLQTVQVREHRLRAYIVIIMVKGKAIPVTGREGP
jgi:hypothetical protein